MIAERTTEQRAAQAANQRRRVNERLAKNECIDCGAPDPVVISPKVRFCAKCRDGRARRHKELMQARKDAGLCSACKQPAAPNVVCQKCVVARIEANRQTRRRTRLFVVAALGGKCVDCSEGDMRVLTLDHVNGDGAEHRREKGDSSRRIWRDVEKQIIKLGKPTREVALRCYNCHFKKDLKLWWWVEENVTRLF